MQVYICTAGPRQPQGVYAYQYLVLTLGIHVEVCGLDGMAPARNWELVPGGQHPAGQSERLPGHRQGLRDRQQIWQIRRGVRVRSSGTGAAADQCDVAHSEQRGRLESILTEHEELPIEVVNHGLACAGWR